MWGPGCSLGLPALCSGVALCAAPQPWVMGVLSHSWVRAGDRESMESSRAPPDLSGDAVGNKAWPGTCPSPGMALSHTLRFSRNCRPCAPWGGTLQGLPGVMQCPHTWYLNRDVGRGHLDLSVTETRAVPWVSLSSGKGCCSPALSQPLHPFMQPWLGWAGLVLVASVP